jgi:hypothetical protein
VEPAVEKSPGRTWFVLRRIFAVALVLLNVGVIVLAPDVVWLPLRKSGKVLVSRISDGIPSSDHDLRVGRAQLEPRTAAAFDLVSPGLHLFELTTSERCRKLTFVAEIWREGALESTHTLITKPLPRRDSSALFCLKVTTEPGPSGSIALDFAMQSAPVTSDDGTREWTAVSVRTSKRIELEANGGMPNGMASSRWSSFSHAATDSTTQEFELVALGYGDSPATGDGPFTGDGVVSLFVRIRAEFDATTER